MASIRVPFRAGYAVRWTDGSEWKIQVGQPEIQWKWGFQLGWKRRRRGEMKKLNQPAQGT